MELRKCFFSVVGKRCKHGICEIHRAWYQICRVRDLDSLIYHKVGFLLVTPANILHDTRESSSSQRENIKHHNAT